MVYPGKYGASFVVPQADAGKRLGGAADATEDLTEYAQQICAIGHDHRHRTETEQRGNARLIAAAPDLLEATKLLLDALTGNQLGCTQFEALKKQARAAIARALPQGAPE